MSTSRSRRGRSAGRDADQRGRRQLRVRSRGGLLASDALRYAGTATTLPSEGSAELPVHGASTLKVDRPHVANGGSVTFSGQVEGRPLPEREARRDYRSASATNGRPSARSAPMRGRVEHRIPVQTHVRRRGIRFRRGCPGEAGFPLEPGHSPPVPSPLGVDHARPPRPTKEKKTTSEESAADHRLRQRDRDARRCSSPWVESPGPRPSSRDTISGLTH